MNTTITKTNKILAALFAALSLLFIILMATNNTFFTWTFSRHQNILSWYVRPIFMIPFCYYAYKRNPMGISLTVFLLLTSMFWFPHPELVDAKVQGFLQMEKEYLTQNWTLSKISISAMVPLSMAGLAYAFWKRSAKAGILLIVAIAVAKALWSVVEGGEAGTAVIIPATLGLVVCIVFIYYGLKRAKKQKAEH
jgi:glucose-6-phosphate-specific signal transduction histidine kinase